MSWYLAFFNPFLLGPILGGLLGNFSLGLITGGLTILVWGFSPGLNFIVITTILLVKLTGNINLEIIFIYTLSIAYLITDRKYQKRPGLITMKDKILVIMALMSIITYQIWSYFLGLIPAGFLNELNIASIIIVLAGLLLTLQRGKIVINPDLKNKKQGELLLFIFQISTIVLAIKGCWFSIPVWLTGVFIYKIRPFLQIYLSRNWSDRTFTGKGSKLNLRNICLYGGLSLACFLLLPINHFMLGMALIGTIGFNYWRPQQNPVIETIYLSVIIGILASRLGFLS